MGARCCTERKEPPGQSATTERKAPELKITPPPEAAGSSTAGSPSSPKPVAGGGGSAAKERKQSKVGVYDSKKRGLSIGVSSKDDDAYKFDKAFEDNDLKAFVSLLSSQQPIDAFEERMHPWAEDPKTVGALAGTQLAILASVAEVDSPSIKQDIREAGGIPPLVGFLKSGQKDRVETAVVALSFLTADSPPNTVLAHQEGAMPELMKHLESPISGLRAAAATTLRNICVEGDTYRAEFVKLGGIKGLVQQVASTPDGALNYADVQLEAVLNIQDLIEDEEGGLIVDFAKEAVKHGVRERLQKLTECEDDEVCGSAQEVLEALSGLDDEKSEGALKPP